MYQKHSSVLLFLTIIAQLMISNFAFAANSSSGSEETIELSEKKKQHKKIKNSKKSKYDDSYSYDDGLNKKPQKSSKYSEHTPKKKSKKRKNYDSDDREEFPRKKSDRRDSAEQKTSKVIKLSSDDESEYGKYDDESDNSDYTPKNKSKTSEKYHNLRSGGTKKEEDHKYYKRKKSKNNDRRRSEDRTNDESAQIKGAGDISYRNIDVYKTAKYSLEEILKFNREELMPVYVSGRDAHELKFSNGKKIGPASMKTLLEIYTYLALTPPEIATNIITKIKNNVIRSRCAQYQKEKTVDDIHKEIYSYFENQLCHNDLPISSGTSDQKEFKEKLWAGWSAGKRCNEIAAQTYYNPDPKVTQSTPVKPTSNPIVTSPTPIQPSKQTADIMPNQPTKIEDTTPAPSSIPTVNPTPNQPIQTTNPIANMTTEKPAQPVQSSFQKDPRLSSNSGQNFSSSAWTQWGSQELQKIPYQPTQTSSSITPTSNPNLPATIPVIGAAQNPPGRSVSFNQQVPHVPTSPSITTQNQPAVDPNALSKAVEQFIAAYLSNFYQIKQ